jgi:hypothetical protein
MASYYLIPPLRFLRFSTGGNANAANYNTNGSYDVGMWQGASLPPVTVTGQSLRISADSGPAEAAAAPPATR